MENYCIRKCTLTDIDNIKYISSKTFEQTFGDDNSKEDMENYLKDNFSDEKVKNELNNEGSLFYIAEKNNEPAAYMKVNFDNAQTENGYKNSLEIQRIYVLEEHKSKKLGKRLIEKAKEIGKEHKLDYIWLGVWENNFNAIKFYEKQGFKKFDTHIFKLGNDEQTDNLMKFML